MKALLALVMICNVALFGQETAKMPAAAPEGPVWSWLSGDGDPRMKLEVLLDQKVVFETSFAVANQMREAIPKTPSHTAIAFSFEAERPIAWRGYREENTLSPAKQKIRCDIWMAGADPTAIVFGVSFSTPDSILMNTLHVASPTTGARSEIAHGLVIVTSPTSKKEPNKSVQTTPRLRPAVSDL